MQAYFASHTWSGVHHGAQSFAQVDIYSAQWMGNYSEEHLNSGMKGRIFFSSTDGLG